MVFVMSFSIDNIAKLFRLSYEIVDRRYGWICFSFENLFRLRGAQFKYLCPIDYIYIYI